MIRRRKSVLALLTVGLACGAGAAVASIDVTRHEIVMRGNSFTPRDLTVDLGDTIVWKNVDIVRHNAVRAETFDTGELRTGDSNSWIPADTGTYRYRCTIHQRMRGTVTVATKP